MPLVGKEFHWRANNRLTERISAVRMKSTTVDAVLKSLNDQTLIEMTLAGQNACFEALLDRHLEAVRKRVGAMIPNKAEAEDVLQEVQLKAWKHLASFRRDSSFRTWITRIAINEALQSMRRARTRHRWDVMDLDRLAASTGSAEQLYARQEMAGTVRRAIRQLPMKFQQILVLREFREMTVKEAARELNSNLPLVKTRLFRARAMLSKVLRRWNKPAPDWQAEIAA
jgi:RNA polymerase sigma factor (sigma-70 family)